MTRALPLWCCLQPESKLAVLELMKRLGMNTFDGPQPVWQEWPTIDYKLILISDSDREYIRLGKVAREMQLKPHSPKRVA